MGRLYTHLNTVTVGSQPGSHKSRTSQAVTLTSTPMDFKFNERQHYTARIIDRNYGKRHETMIRRQQDYELGMGLLAAIYYDNFNAQLWGCAGSSQLTH